MEWPLFLRFPRVEERGGAEEVERGRERDGEEAENVKGGESMKAEWVLKEVESGRSMRWNGGSPMV